MFSFQIEQMCFAYTITKNPIWKWEFANGALTHYAYGALKPENKRCKIQFALEILQMGQKGFVL